MKFKGHLESPGLGWLTCPTSWVYTLLGSPLRLSQAWEINDPLLLAMLLVWKVYNTCTWRLLSAIARTRQSPFVNVPAPVLIWVFLRRESWFHSVRVFAWERKIQVLVALAVSPQWLSLLDSLVSLVQRSGGSQLDHFSCYVIMISLVGAMGNQICYDFFLWVLNNFIFNHAFIQTGIQGFLLQWKMSVFLLKGVQCHILCSFS